MLSEHLAGEGIRHTVCVATEYGRIVLTDHPLVTIRQGRMEKEEMKKFIAEKNFFAVVDATHPYAREVTRNIKAAADEINTAFGRDIPYFRLKREDFSLGGGEEDSGQDGITRFETDEACAEALGKTKGNILLTTGSKRLPCYCVSEEVKSRIYVRILPGMESFSRCIGQGIRGRQIIAMQGPFTAEMNEAMIRQYEISVLVTKESGVYGGFPEKAAAVKRTGIKMFVIERPEDEGNSFSEVCCEIEKLWKKEEDEKTAGRDFRITLAGAGMGSRDGMTEEVRSAVYEADILLGSERILEPYQARLEKYPFYLPEQILPYLKKMYEKNRWTGERKVVVLFSGDTGFYSGCERLYRELERAIRQGDIGGTLRVLPGISCVAALAARIGESWQDAAVYSMHGKKLSNLVGKIRRNGKTFLLTGGVADVNLLGALLEKADMKECRVAVGSQLSYGEEQVRWLSPGECRELSAERLYICMVKNPRPEESRLTHGMGDQVFIRDKVPMTKQEVRAVSICKLHLCAGAVVYDIGSGTGSVAVETAALSDGIQVYAIERRKEAVSLIKKNIEKFGLENVTVVDAQAPDGFEGLPAATHAFIGGSGGHLREILEELYRRSPGIRIVINAVSVETICEIEKCLRMFGIEEAETVQIQVNRAKEAGNYHLMRAENPVWICAFYLGSQGSDSSLS